MNLILLCLLWKLHRSSESRIMFDPICRVLVLFTYSASPSFSIRSELFFTILAKAFLDSLAVLQDAPRYSYYDYLLAYILTLDRCTGFHNTDVTAILITILNLIHMFDRLRSSPHPSSHSRL
jgi:hypothetical protein